MQCAECKSTENGGLWCEVHQAGKVVAHVCQSCAEKMADPKVDVTATMNGQPISVEVTEGGETFQQSSRCLRCKSSTATKFFCDPLGDWPRGLAGGLCDHCARALLTIEYAAADGNDRALSLLRAQRKASIAVEEM